MDHQHPGWGLLCQMDGNRMGVAVAVLALALGSVAVFGVVIVVAPAVASSVCKRSAAGARPDYSLFVGIAKSDCKFVAGAARLDYTGSAVAVEPARFAKDSHRFAAARREGTPLVVRCVAWEVGIAEGIDCSVRGHDEGVNHHDGFSVYVFVPDVLLPPAVADPLYPCCIYGVSCPQRQSRGRRKSPLCGGERIAQ